MRTGIIGIVGTVALLMGATCLLHAEVNPCKSKVKPARTVYLYPEGQGAGKGLPEAEGPIESNGYVRDEYIEDEGHALQTGDEARIDLYFPKKPNGQMIVCCPGGGYRMTCLYKEGVYVADWMLQRGISVCVVHYRMPNGHWKLPLQDVQNAFRYCRSHAKEWKVDQIGVMGFSAGGHLAASASTLFTDEITRPDFSVLIYPVITMNKYLTHKGTRERLLGKDSDWDCDTIPAGVWKTNQKKFAALQRHYSLEKQVKPTTPPTFIALSANDKTVPAQNSLTYFSMLVKNGVPSEMHIWPEGGHGWGYTKQAFQQEGKTDSFAYARPVFDNCLERWLKDIHNKANN